MYSTRLNALAKWNYPVFGGQRFGIDLAVGPGLNVLTHAYFPWKAQLSNITNSFDRFGLLATGSAGVHERIGDNFRLSADIRWTRGLTNMASSSEIFASGTTYAIEETSIGLALSYGL